MSGKEQQTSSPIDDSGASRCTDRPGSTPVLPPVELDPTTNGLQLESERTLPAFELVRPPVQSPVYVLVVSSSSEMDNLQRAPGSSLNVTTKSVASIEQYQNVLRHFLAARRCAKVAELWVANVIGVDAQLGPAIGGRAVTEGDLYEPLQSLCEDDEPTSVRVFQLTYQNGLPSAESPPAKDPGHQKSGGQRKPKRAALSGAEFHRLAVPDGAGPAEAHGALARALDAMEASSCGRATSEELIQQLSSAGLEHLQVSGFPGEAATMTFAPYQDAPAVPNFPDEPEQNALGRFDDILNKPPVECDAASGGQLNVAVGIVVKNYPDDTRDGGGMDEESIEKTAQLLNCSSSSTHMLTGRVSKQDVQDFILQMSCKYDGRSIGTVYLFVSAHGDATGFVASDDRTVSVREVVLPLTQLGGFVLLLYQACRGDRRHWADGDKPPDNYIGGLLFPNCDIEGCCLPFDLLPSVCRLGAIFASSAGYVCYRRASSGSLMLTALREVVRDIAGDAPTIGVKLLAERTQQRLRDTWPGGKVGHQQQDGLDRQCYVQIQFTLLGCQDADIDVAIRPEG